ncbi:MAG: aldehyde dehydrogenase family protein, partial [Planctomycetota bacterium]
MPDKPIADVIATARDAQVAWRRAPARRRLRVIRQVRRSIGDDPTGWAESCTPPQQRTLAESLGAEVGPLADACRWLERNATRRLRSRYEGGWLDQWKPGGVSVRVTRKPLGVVLVIGAGNYPLFLLAAPAIQAIAAGNAVLLKPPPGGEAAAGRLNAALVAGGLDPRLCPVLESSAEAAEAAMDAGVDHVVVTGSAATGRAVARRAAERLTPCTLECSGVDAVVVLPGADLERVADCVAWGLSFNSGATCIAPRRVIAGTAQLDRLEPLLRERLASAPSRRITQTVADAALRLVEQAVSVGSRVASPAGFDARPLSHGHTAPVVIRAGDTRPALLDEDCFGPVAVLVAAESDDERVAAANDCPYALGAAVFGPDGHGEAWEAAAELRAGCVTVDDLIAPTADPRVPFGGVGESGYGVTRGAEGLLAMTRPQAIA